MKSILFGILFLFCVSTAAAQNSAKKARDKSAHKKLTPLEELAQHKESYDYCAFTNKYTAQQRLKLYPFSKATKILAVSYDSPGFGQTDDDPAAVAYAQTVGLHVKDGILNHSTLHEVKELSALQINELTNILFNTNYRKIGTNGYSFGKCFEPRNAFVFFNAEGKVFDYLQICFECKNSSSSTDKIDVGVLCTQKYDLLRKYMIALGIKRGSSLNEK